MVKRIFCILLVPSLLFFGGCNTKGSDYREPENRLFVSAIGIDRKGDNIKICIEGVGAENNNGSDSYKVKQFYGSGKSVIAAVYEITNDLPKNVNFSHLSLVVVGQEVTGENFKKLLEFAFNHKEVPLSAYLAVTESAERLISLKRESSKPLGFEISNLLKEDTDGTGMEGYATLLSVINAKSGSGYFLLPGFTAKGKEYFYTHTELFKGNKPLCRLTREETQMLCIAANRFMGGELKVNNQVITVTGCKTSARWEKDNNLNLNVKIKSENGNYNTKDLSRNLEKSIKGIVIRFRDQYKQNPFGFAESNSNKFTSAKVSVKCSIDNGGM